jgi:hypothetical protein
MGIILLGVSCGYKSKPTDKDDKTDYVAITTTVGELNLVEPNRQKKDKPKKNLADIERYSLCGNRIV